jgi:hypothetical protein
VRRTTVSLMLAGWLFADSMLGLMIVGLASDPGGPQPTKSPVPGSAMPSAEPSITPKPKVTEAKAADGVAQKAVVYKLAIAGRTDAQVAAEVHRQYAAMTKGGRTAAFALTFGTSNAPGEGIALAKRANRLLKKAAPQIFSGAAQRDFWQSTSSGAFRSGTVRVEVYLFNTK